MPEASVRGSALMLALMMLALSVGIISTLLTLTSAQTSAVSHERDDLQALFVAEAGLSATLAELRTSVPGAALAVSGTFGGGRYLATCPAAAPTDGRVVTVTAWVSGSLSSGDTRTQRRVIEATLEPVRVAARAVTGIGAITMANKAFTDSWDSTLGTYDSQAKSAYQAMPRAQLVGADVLAGGSVGLSNFAGIFGTATPGPGGQVNETSFSGYVGTIGSAATSTPTAQTVTAPTVSNKEDPVSLDGESQSYGPGNFAFDSIRAANGSNLTVQGPAQVVIGSGGVSITSSSTFLVDATNGPVSIYVTGGGGVAAGSTTTFESIAPRPADVTIYVLDGGSVSIGSNHQFTGSIHAPASRVTLKNGFEVFGGIVGASITLQNTARVHYDADLARRGPVIPGRFQMRCWRELAPGATG